MTADASNSLAGLNETDLTASALAVTSAYGLNTTVDPNATTSGAVINSSTQPGSDLNNDGSADLLWENQQSGVTYIWYMDGTQLLDYEAGLVIPSGYDVVALSDLNNDGQTDLLVHGPQNGETYAWYLDGNGQLASFEFVTWLTPNWEFAGTGDFNGDNETDFLWFDTDTGSLNVWYMDGITFQGFEQITTGLVGYEVAGTGDFNDDNQTDLVWTNASYGTVSFWYMDGATPVGGGLVAQNMFGWSMEGTGDFNNDGTSDLLWLSTQTGDLAAWYMQGTTLIGGDFFSQIDPVWNPIAIDRGGAPDLTLQSLVVPATATVGDTIDISLTVSNQGSSTANANSVQYYLSDDASFDPNTDTLLGETSVSALKSGGTSDQTFSFTYTDTLGTGEKYLLAVTDASGSLLEADESNNLAVQALSVAGPDFTDLALQNAQAPASVSTGSSLDLSVTVANLGTLATPASTVSFYLSDDASFDSGTDTLLGSSAIAALDASGTALAQLSLTYNSAYGLGNKYVLFVVDGDNQITESDETNNLLATPITVTEAVGPDLVVQSQTATPTDITVGDSFTLAASVVNTGNASSGSSVLRYYLSDDTILDANDQFLGGDAVSALDINTSSPEDFTTTYSATWGTGTKYVLFVADGSDLVTETNETNNVSYVEINVSAPPVPGKDLVITEAAVSTPTPGTVIYGETVDLTAVVKNQGTDATASSQLTYYLSDDATLDGSDIVLGSSLVDGLTSNTTSPETFSFTYSDTYGSGTKYILFVADSDNTVGETDETNNISYVALQAVPPVTGPPDLVISDLTVNDTTLSPGNTLSFSVTIANQGGDQAGSSFVGYIISDDTTFSFLDDVFLTDAAVSSLNAGDSTTLTYSTTYDASWGTGTKYVLVISDFYQSITEADETNNQAFTTITVS